MGCLRLILVASFLLGLSLQLEALPNRNPIANADSAGFVRLTHLEFPIDADDKLRLFYLEFTSNPAFEPNVFGVFWHMPIFSSKVELTKSNELKWYAPDGKTYYFCAHSTEKKGKEAVSFVDNTATWKALKTRNGFDIASLKDATSLTYTDSRLQEFTINGKQRYIINYRRDGQVASVRERSGQVVLAFEYHKDQKHVKSIKNVEGIYSFEYHVRKSGDILSGDNFYGQSLLLSTITHPNNGKLESFEYTRVNSRPRAILLKNLAEVVTSPLRVNKLNAKSDGEDKGWIEWCATTGIIMADNGGEYSIGSDKYDSFFPNFKPGQGASKFSAIKYKNPDMPYPQIRLFDYENYYEILGDPANGEITRNSLIGACGPLKMRTRKVEKLAGDLKSLPNPAATDWQLVKINSFDPQGRLVRELYSNGDEKTVIYKELARGVKSIEKFKNGLLEQRKVLSFTGSVLEKMHIGNGIEYKTITDIQGGFREEWENGRVVRRVEFHGEKVSKVKIFDKDGQMKIFDLSELESYKLY